MYHSTLGVPGYDAWKLSYPPHWDDEPEEEEEEDDEDLEEIDEEE